LDPERTGAGPGSRCVSEVEPSKSASPRLKELTDKLLESIVELEPVEATGLGLHASDHRLPDASVPAFEQREERWRSLLALCEQVPDAELEPAERIDRDLAAGQLRVRLHDLVTRLEPQRNPTYYTSTVTASVFLLLLREHAPMPERLEAIASRLEQVPGFLAEAMLRLEKPPALWVEIALDDAEGAMEFLHATVPVLAGQHPGLTDRLLAANLKAVRALSSFADFLQRDLALQAVPSFAAGREVFEHNLRHRHRIADSPEELLDMGRQELDRARRAMERLARDAGEPGWHEMLESIQMHHPSGPELLAAYEEALERTRRFVAERDLATLPEDEELEIIETPAFLRHVIPFAAYYPPAPFEEKRKGFFLVTAPPDDETRQARLRGHSYASITLTALHEAFPGHHLQLTRSAHTGSPLRRLADSSMFGEGWALYCEEMMYEEGFYDRKTRLLQLKDLAWRACRVIIDVGLHTGSMDFHDAVEMLEREVKMDRQSAEAEVKWYSLAPTYPLSYLRGMREILRMRDRWRERGPYVAKAFHDALLSAGTLPMSLAERHVFGG
jgi:uncharacterized protein (DUF885 family)